MGGEKQATPHDDLIGQIMDSRVPKNEREWAASREIAALRARLAPPTTHADDEVAVDNLTYAAESGDHIATRACAEGLRRRLADLRARAEAAERALAECREAVAELRAEVRKTVPLVMDALKTKEPRDA